VANHSISTARQSSVRQCWSVLASIHCCTPYTIIQSIEIWRLKYQRGYFKIRIAVFNYLFTFKNIHLRSNSYNFWMQQNIAIKFMEYVAWIFRCKRCQFGEKLCYNSRDNELFLTGYFLLARLVYSIPIRPPIYLSVRPSSFCGTSFIQKFWRLLLSGGVKQGWGVENKLFLFEQLIIICSNISHVPSRGPKFRIDVNWMNYMNSRPVLEAQQCFNQLLSSPVCAVMQSNDRRVLRLKMLAIAYNTTINYVCRENVESILHINPCLSLSE